MTTPASAARVAPDDPESGAIAIIYSVSMLLFIGLLAVVLDIGAMRSDIRHAQTTADMAATAGVLSLLESAEGSPVDACNDAWEYFLENIGNPAPQVPPNCSEFAVACDTNAATSVTGTAGEYEVTITWPVPDGELTDGVREEDGDACNRLMVRADRTRGFIFGSALLGVASSAQVGRPAIALADEGTLSEAVINIIVLDKYGCVALNASGGGGIQARAGESTFYDEKNDIWFDEWVPGRIYVDSDGSTCSGGQTTIDAGGGSKIYAYGRDHEEDPPEPGQIRLFALPPGQPCATPACNPSQIRTAYPAGGPGIWPPPTNLSERINRDLGDHRFNCKGDYGYLDGIGSNLDRGVTSPSGAWGVQPCPPGQHSSPYVDQLRDAFGAADSMAGHLGPGKFQRWRDPDLDPDLSSHDLSCDMNNLGNVTVEAANWWIDCPGAQGLRVRGNTNLTIEGGNLVFLNKLQVEQTARFRFNTNNPETQVHPECQTSIVGDCLYRSSSEGAYAYFAGQAGGGGLQSIDQTSSTAGVEFHNTVVILRNSRVRISQGDVVWTAPHVVDRTRTYPFANLALWFDGGHLDIDMTGGGNYELEGVFFTPNSHVKVSGGGSGRPHAAQFFSWRLTATGGGGLISTPDPNRGLSVPIFEGIRLIR